MVSKNPWADWAQFFFGGRGQRHNHAVQIWWRLVQGFWVGWGSKFAFPHILWRSFLQHTLSSWGVIRSHRPCLTFLAFNVLSVGRCRDDTVSRGHVRLSVKPRCSSTHVSADGVGVWRTAQLLAGRRRAIVWTAHLRCRTVRVSERRLYSRAVGLWSGQRLRWPVWWTRQLQ